MLIQPFSKRANNPQPTLSALKVILTPENRSVAKSDRHIRDKGVPYEFTDAGQLMTDFFNEVDRVLKEVQGK